MSRYFSSYVLLHYQALRKKSTGRSYWLLARTKAKQRERKGESSVDQDMVAVREGKRHQLLKMGMERVELLPLLLNNLSLRKQRIKTLGSSDSDNHSAYTRHFIVGSFLYNTNYKSIILYIDIYTGQ